MSYLPGVVGVPQVCTTEEFTDMEKRYQLEEEKYAIHQNVGQLNGEVESDTGSDYSGYSYFS